MGGEPGYGAPDKRSRFQMGETGAAVTVGQILERFFQSDEVLAAIISVMLTALLVVVGRFLTPKGKVAWSVSHQSTFFWRPQPTPAQPAAPAQPTAPAQPAAHVPAQNARVVLVYTRDIWIQNVGRAVVTDVEVVLNYDPQHFEIWPQRNFATTTNPRGNYIIKLDSLNPGEWMVVSLLNVDAEIPIVTNVRWEGGQAKERPMAPQQVLPKWARALVAALLLVGVFSLIYFAFRIIQSFFAS